jgi:hypothetical protein
MTKARYNTLVRFGKVVRVLDKIIVGIVRLVCLVPFAWFVVYFIVPALKLIRLDLFTDENTRQGWRDLPKNVVHSLTDAYQFVSSPLGERVLGGVFLILVMLVVTVGVWNVRIRGLGGIRIEQ